MLSTPQMAANVAPRPRFPAERVLVIRLGALGDVVRTRFAFPGLRELYPDARIDWLIEDRAVAGLAGIIGLDEAVVVPRRELRAGRPWRLQTTARGLIRELRSRRYQIAVDFHSILKSGLLALGGRIPLRIGLDAPLGREGSHRLATHRVPVPDPHISRFERNALLLRFLGAGTPQVAPRLELPPAAAQGLGDLPMRYCAIHPGTSPSTAYKRWAPEAFAAVASALREQAGLASLVTWGPVPGERERAIEVVEASRGAARLAPPTGSTDSLLALLQGARLFIGSDSGPVHLASLAGTPVVVVFGPTDPIENHPFEAVGARVVRQDVGCNPCRDGCPARSCMRAVHPPEVVEAALEILGDA